MSEVAIQRFACDGCGKKYPWKLELTNKKAKCKCGNIMRVPDLTITSEDPPALPDEGIFDFIDNAPEIASPRIAAIRAAAMPVAMPVAAAGKSVSGKAVAGRATGVKASQVLGYRQGPTQRERTRASQQFDTIHDLKRDVYVPTALIVGSFLAYFAWLLIHGSANSSASLGFYGAVMAVSFAIKTVFMILGAFVVASLASVSFGPFWTAVLKLAAVSIAPDIFATIVEQAIGAPGAGLLAGSLALAFYWFLISWLFSMDANEAWVVVVLFGFLRWILTFAIGMLVISMLMSGGGSSVGSGFTGASAVPSATAEAAELTETVEAAKENGNLIEGLDYIKNTGRQSAMTDTIKGLYAAGARNVWFHVSRDINGKTEPHELIVEWPRDAKKREAMVAAIKESQIRRAKAWKEQHPDWAPLEEDPVTDEGGKYVELPLGG